MITLTNDSSWQWTGQLSTKCHAYYYDPGVGQNIYLVIHGPMADLHLIPDSKSLYTSVQHWLNTFLLHQCLTDINLRVYTWGISFGSHVCLNSLYKIMICSYPVILNSAKKWTVHCYQCISIMFIMPWNISFSIFLLDLFGIFCQFLFICLLMDLINQWT